ncbi:MAG TPA: diguanylate cyclase [Dissulfurispiraceae bacterium]|nr:diguanylate cyclase [Dissulfurispiraceae bacterium]
MKVLVVTSAQNSAKGLCLILEAEGYECLILSKSDQAINTIYHELPEMVMLDIALTKPSAAEILSKLKSAPSTWDIPVLIIASMKSASKIAKCYELGAHDYISKPFFKEEIVARIRNVGYVCEKMKEFEKLLVRDYLTGIYNRKFFMERFVEELAWAARYQEPLSFIILDIDHFKKINDTYGHSCGDEVLRQLSKILTSTLRAHDIVARYGGEEFVVLLSNTNVDECLTVAEKLRITVQESDFHCAENSITLPVTISIGVTSSDSGFDLNPDSMIIKADHALYEAKGAGRNRVVSSTEKGSMSVNES